MADCVCNCRDEGEEGANEVCTAVLEQVSSVIGAHVLTGAGALRSERNVCDKGALLRALSRTAVSYSSRFSAVMEQLLHLAS
jgi:hypothetical protein